jgi:hypothetical protein
MFYSVALKASVFNFMDVVYCPSCAVFDEWVIVVRRSVNGSYATVSK